MFVVFIVSKFVNLRPMHHGNGNYCEVCSRNLIKYLKIWKIELMTLVDVWFLENSQKILTIWKNFQNSIFN